MVLRNACQLTYIKKAKKTGKFESFWELKCDGTKESRCLVENAKCRKNTFKCKPGFVLNTCSIDKPCLTKDKSFDTYALFPRKWKGGAQLVKLYLNGKKVGESIQVCVKPEDGGHGAPSAPFKP